jgi:hypothetical protein
MIQQYGVKEARVEEVFTLDFDEIKKNGYITACPEIHTPFINLFLFFLPV